MAKYTLTFDERNKGFTSFHSYFPQWMVSLNNSFYSMSNGELYIHNSETVNRNTFYNVTYPSRMELIVNDNYSDNKVFNAISLEGTIAWDIVYTTNMTNGTVEDIEFVEKEKEWYAYLRRSEDTADTSSLSTQGVGEATVVLAKVFTFDTIPDNVNIGDLLYVYNASNEFNIIGEITAHDSTTITTDEVTNPVLVGEFVVVVKNNRAEGAEARGYFLKLDMEMTSAITQELFAVNVDASKSFQ